MTWPRPVTALPPRLLLPLLLLCSSVPPTAPLSCAPCEKTACAKVECADQPVPDVCGCCLVCARGAGQPCGGYFDSLGVCGKGLVCQTAPRHGQLVDADAAEGNCTQNVTACPHQLCQLMLGRCVCSSLESCQPSNVYSNPTSFPSQALCEEAARQAPPATKTPVSVPLAGCPGVVCDGGAASCPADSVLKTEPAARPACCPPVGVCLCDLETCSGTAGCPPGQQAVLQLPGTGRPGHCCSRWRCKPAESPPSATNSSGSCSHAGRQYGPGQRWMADKCTRCQCKKGLTFCKTTECAPLAGCAGRVAHRPDQCCPACVEGCTSPSGVHHNSSERWLEDDCTTCSCVAGKPRCRSPMCRVSCRNPRHVPGRCCPVCDECDVTCQHGYRTSPDGESLCECLTAHEAAATAQPCPRLAGCRRVCPHGFRIDERGCERCKCRKCRKLKDCTKKCPFGFLSDERACPVCECREGPEKPLDHRGCFTQEGVSRAEGEQWHDGCRHCTCQDGQEMCAVISCPVPNCARPEIPAAHCCPVCPDGSPLPSASLNASVCQSVDGRMYAEGHSWQPHVCARCLCQSGRVLCSSPGCPPAACARPQPPAAGRCCAACPPPPAVGPACRDAAEGWRQAGVVWRRSACVSCACHGGQTRCFHEQCPPLNCARPVLRKHHCCPICLEAPRPAGCVRGNVTIPEGGRWSDGECVTCECRHGRPSVLVCARNACTQPCKEGGDPCCPACKGGDRRSFHSLDGVSGATPPTAGRPPEGRPRTTQRGVHRQPEEQQQPSHYYVVLCAVLGCLALLLVGGLIAWWVRRQRSGYSPKNVTEEKRPLNDPQIMHFVRLDGRGIRQDLLMLEPPNSAHDA